jgi:RHS repeat-associated protein
VAASYPVTQAGYAFLYVSNEQPTLTDVYFDDVKMTHTSKIIQYNEYYPFGMQSAESYTKANSANNFLYDQGGELNTTSGWYDLSFRNYDPALGRFHQVDPMATSFHNLTPYNYAGNNPVMNTDPSGAFLKAGPSGDVTPPQYQTGSSMPVFSSGSWSSDGTIFDDYDGGGGGYFGNPGVTPIDRLIYRMFLASGASNYGTYVQSQGLSGLLESEDLILGQGGGGLSDKLVFDPETYTYRRASPAVRNGVAGYWISNGSVTVTRDPTYPDGYNAVQNRWFLPVHESPSDAKFAGFGISGVPFYATSVNGGFTYETAYYLYTRNFDGTYVEKEKEGLKFLQMSKTPFWNTDMGQDIISSLTFLGDPDKREGIGNMMQEQFWDGLLEGIMDEIWPFKIPIFVDPGPEEPISYNDRH